MSFGPYVSNMTPNKFSRLGDVDFTITGTGFMSQSPPTVYFRSGNQKLDCIISSFTYTQINCHFVKIASSLKSIDSDFAGFIVIGRQKFICKNFEKYKFWEI